MTPGRGGRVWPLLLVLAALQFTHILDFMILMPLGPRCMREMGITPGQFGTLVSAYAFSAFGAGLAAAWGIDRFDRKTVVLVLYVGFLAGTLACGLTRSFVPLLLARCVAGAFGGVLGAVVLAVVGDAVPPERRGLAMGMVMSAFSVATIVGVPAGLMIADALGTRAPFLVLGGLSGVFLVLAGVVLPSMRGHLRGSARTAEPAWRVLTRPELLWAYAVMVCLVLSTFSIIPYLATYTVTNMGLKEEQLPWLYLTGGVATLATMSLFGHLADWLGKLLMFRVLAVLTAVPLVLITNLGPSSLAVVLGLTTLFMVLSSGRMVPAMAMMTSSAAPSYRGSFMSVNASVQQLTMGAASLLGGALLSQAEPGGPMAGFPLVGVLACVAIGASVVLAGSLRTVADDPAALLETRALLAETAQATAPLPETVEGIP